LGVIENILPISKILARYIYEGDVTDTTGVYDASVVNSVTYINNGGVGQSGNFLNSDAYAMVSGTSQLKLDMRFDTTISMLIKITANNKWYSFFSYGSHQNWGVMSILIGGLPIFFYSVPSGGSIGISGTTAIPLNTYVHLAWVRDFTNREMKLYYNGVLEKTNILQAMDTYSLDAIPNEIYIGKSFVYRIPAPCFLDETILWRTALTDTEVLKLATDQLSGININP